MFLIAIDGVMRVSGSDIPDPTGIRLYKALCDAGRVVLLGSSAGRDKDQWFLAHEELNYHGDYVEYREEYGPDEVARRIQQTIKARGHYGSIELVVDPDPTVIARLHDRAVTALLYLSPKFSNPAFRPDYESKARPWDELMSALEYQSELKVKHNPLPPLDEVFDA